MSGYFSTHAIGEFKMKIFGSLYSLILILLSRTCGCL